MCGAKAVRLLQSIDDRLGDQDTRLQAIETAINKLGSSMGDGSMSEEDKQELSRLMLEPLFDVMMEYSMYAHSDMIDEAIRRMKQAPTAAEAIKELPLQVYTFLVRKAQVMERVNIRGSVSKNTKVAITAAYARDHEDWPWRKDYQYQANSAKRFLLGSLFRTGGNAYESYGSQQFRTALLEVFPRPDDGLNEEVPLDTPIEHCSAAQLAWLETLVQYLLRHGPTAKLPLGDAERTDFANQYRKTMQDIQGGARKGQLVTVKNVPALPIEP